MAGWEAGGEDAVYDRETLYGYMNGGAEVYLEKVAAGLVRRGARVTIFCAAHDAAPADEVRHGIRFVRRGSKM